MGWRVELLTKTGRAFGDAVNTRTRRALGDEVAQPVMPVVTCLTPLAEHFS